MAARTFGNASLSCLTSGQLESLAAVGINESDLIDKGCDPVLLNTCGIDATNVVETYPLYNESQGLYKKWGDIKLPWGHFDSTSDERWQIADYVDTVSYETGDTVYRFEDSSYRVVVYRATVDVASPAGVFDPTKWEQVCSVVVSEPIGLPSIEELRNKYEYYNLSLDGSAEWGKFDNLWSNDLVEPSSNSWGNARIDRGNFYKSGDTVLYDSSCGDYTCAYTAIDDVPANQDLIVPGPPPSSYWQRLYCVKNGDPSKCVKQSTCPRGYRLVSLSFGEADLICVPVESTTGVGPRQ